MEDTPEKIGKYKIESLLKKGGMSYLYLATDPDTQGPVAVKVLSPKYLSNQKAIERFQKESKIISMSDHPNIVKFLDQGKWKGGYYIVLEFIQGISLRQYILKTPMSLQRALEILLEIAYAVCHLHSHGVIHRDLKPENILVAEKGHIKVIDFGIAQLLNEKEAEDIAKLKGLIGTPVYISPEQRQNPESVSFPSDIYSLAIIAYELVLGKLCHGQVHLSLMPKGLHKILNKALQPSPSDRYQDIVDFIADISSYLNSTSFQEETKKGFKYGELFENLQRVQELLIPAIPQDWPNMEIGLIAHQEINTRNTYLDFLKFPNDLYGIVIGFSLAEGPQGIINTAVLRGMIRALSGLTGKPEELAIILNDHIIHDKFHSPFALSYVILNNQQNRLIYISCGKGNLIKIEKDQPEPIHITTPCPCLGEKEGLAFQETSSTWNIGDVIILNPLNNGNTSIEKDEITQLLFLSAVKDSLGLSPQVQVETIYRKIQVSSADLLQRSLFPIISVKRI